MIAFCFGNERSKWSRIFSTKDNLWTSLFNRNKAADVQGQRLREPVYQTSPWALMALATLVKPAMFAPSTSEGTLSPFVNSLPLS